MCVGRAAGAAGVVVVTTGGEAGADTGAGVVSVGSDVVVVTTGAGVAIGDAALTTGAGSVVAGCCTVLTWVSTDAFKVEAEVGSGPASVVTACCWSVGAAASVGAVSSVGTGAAETGATVGVVVGVETVTAWDVVATAVVPRGVAGWAAGDGELARVAAGGGVTAVCFCLCLDGRDSRSGTAGVAPVDGARDD